MHVNVYSTEGGVESVESGVKKAQDGKEYPYVGLTFKNGNSIKFFGKTVSEVEDIIVSLRSGMMSLARFSNLDTERGKEWNH